jgi:NADPH2:quinone reductase
MEYKYVVLTRIGDPDVLQVREDEIPELRRGEVLVKILAAGVVYADIMMRHGKYPGTPALPFTPGYDMVGVVEQTGATVRRAQELLEQRSVQGKLVLLPASP